MYSYWPRINKGCRSILHTTANGQVLKRDAGQLPTFRYNALGQRISHTNALGWTDKTYDNLGRVSKNHQRPRPEHQLQLHRRR